MPLVSPGFDDERLAVLVAWPLDVSDVSDGHDGGNDDDDDDMFGESHVWEAPIKRTLRDAPEPPDHDDSDAGEPEDE